MSINAAAERPPAIDEHGQRMDRMYRVQRHFYDVTRAYYLLGRDDLIAALKPPSGGTVLEIGCGTGRNLVTLAQRHAGVNLFGIDISVEMLASAGKAIEKKGLLHRVQLAQGDATGFSSASIFGRSQFDRILFSYTLSMIPDWTAALRHAVKVLAQGGELHAVDFGSCEGLPRIFRSGLDSWLDRFHVAPRRTLSDIAIDLARDFSLQREFWSSHRGYAQHLILRRPH